MKLGFSTGNRRDIGVTSKSAPTDRFLNFQWLDKDGLRVVRFFNQTHPALAAKMLREMADEIEREGLTHSAVSILPRASSSS